MPRDDRMAADRAVWRRIWAGGGESGQGGAGGGGSGRGGAGGGGARQWLGRGGGGGRGGWLFESLSLP
jgi:hypothetical protein